MGAMGRAPPPPSALVATAAPPVDPLRIVKSEIVAPRGARYDLGLQVRRAEQPRALRGGPDGLAVRWSAVGASVKIDVLAAGAATPEEIAHALHTAIAMAGLDDDPADFPEIARRHPLVAELHRRYPGARLARAPGVWEAFAVAVVEQLVTWEEARDSRRRIWWRWGEPIPGTSLRAAPTGAAIARATPWELRECGLGLRRASTLLGGARRARTLDAMVTLDADEMMRRLRTLPGVGVWTANKVAMSAMGHPDACLEGDAVAPFVTTLALTGRAGGDAEMRACLEPFRPHRARVHRLFELAERDGGVPGVPPRMRPRVDPHRRLPRWT